MYHGEEYISEYIPSDHCRQTASIVLLSTVLSSHKYQTVMDLGCGEGNTVDMFRKFNPLIRWIGLDIESSLEVERRKRSDAEFHSYDGVNIPFEDSSIELIYCHQVLEHVENPFGLIKEIDRVLSNGGVFVGSTSQMEAFHSMSTYSYTPYGFSLLFRDTRLKVVQIRPGIDAVTLIMHRLFGKSKFLSWLIGRYFKKQSPLNSVIGFLGRLLGKSKKDINLMKLLFCGHFAFVVNKQ